MYSWGGDTSDWVTPGAYKYDSARRKYLDKLADDARAKGPRSYRAASSPNLGLVDPRGKTISSDSKNPIVIGVDVTGSMAEWPREIFDRLPLMYQTLSQYRDDVEICFGAIGDATCDSYPLQVNDFGKGVDLEEKLKGLFPEGGGGGQHCETYEMFGYFMQEHCNVPNATSPFLFIFGDECYYDHIQPGHVKGIIGDTLQSPIDSKGMWDKLMQKFNVYMLHKPYSDRGLDRDIVAAWRGALGSQKVIEIPSMERSVDIALGLVAKSWGHFDDFKVNLTARHPDPKDRGSVYKSLMYIDDKPTGKSVVATGTKSKATKSLMDKSGK
ncbi:MAG: hypothetical protein V1906_01960 [Candidatus Woesearchaeota archaeon]